MYFYLMIKSQYAILAMRNNPNNEQKGLNKGGSIINTASFGKSGFMWEKGSYL